VIPTTFGKTQTFACGDLSSDPVFFLHGAASNAFIYGDWIMPELRKTHYAVAVDFVCDVGRSTPRDGDSKNW
jgi:pimeloyl-ACP methyl ester carboxylesterase